MYHNTALFVLQVHSCSNSKYSTYLDSKTGGLKVGVNLLRCNSTELPKSEVQPAIGDSFKKNKKELEKTGTQPDKTVGRKPGQDEQKHNDLPVVLNRKRLANQMRCKRDVPSSLC